MLWLFKDEKVFNESAGIVVFPKVIEVKTASRSVFSQNGNRYIQNFLFQDPYAFIGTRNYIPGNSPKVYETELSFRLLRRFA